MKPQLTKTIIGLFFYTLMATSTSVCNSPSDHADTPEETIEFFGRVKNSLNSLLQNDRLVIIFLNGVEIGRDVTHIGKYASSDEPSNDGFFQISVPNQYQISEKEIAAQGYKTDGVSKWERAKHMEWGSLTNIDTGNDYEGLKYDFVFPSRNNAKYTVKVVYGDYNRLPLSIRESRSTILDESNEVLALSLENVKRKSVESVKFKEEDFVIDNCGGNSPVKQSKDFRAKFVHEYSFSLKTSTLVPMLLTQFQTKFGFHDLEESEEITQQTFTVKPRSKVIYTLTWYEIWETGTIDVKTEKENKTVAFRVKTKLSHEIHSQTVSCR